MDTQQYGRLMYPPTTPVSQGTTLPQINASLPDSSWHSDHQPPSSHPSSSGQSSQMYSLASPSDHVDYSSLSSPFISQHQTDQYSATGHHQSPHPGSLDQDMSSSLTQVDSSIGPNRILTRRQRALLGRRVTHPSLSTESMDSSGQHSSIFFMPPGESRHQTPPHDRERSEGYPSRSDNSSMGAGSTTVPMPLPSPAFSSPPGSGYSPYAIYHNHSRSTSASNSNPRSASPALSVVSTLTSVSSASAPNSQAFAPFPLPSIGNISPIAPRQKQRKQRLFNVDRKAICVYHKEYPNARQEDIAVRYGVERSTISKILKHKTKWLNVPEHEELRVAKHRPSKFPQVEEQLQKWLVETKRTNTVLTDALIRQKAKETAKMLHIHDDKFKASSGWVENFKHRHGIRGGIWHGDGKNTRVARALGAGTFDDGGNGLSPLNPVFEGRSETVAEGNSNYGGDMDITLESEESQNMEMDHGRLPALDSSPISLQPAWQCQSDTSPPAHVSIPSVHPLNRPHLPSMHESTSHSTLVHHHHESAMHLDHITLSSHERHHESDHQTNIHHESHHNSPTTYEEALEIYHNVSPIPSNEGPSLADAEEAINTVILYIDTTGRGILTDQERRSLHNIKCALFQAGSGIPFDRNSV